MPLNVLSLSPKRWLYQPTFVIASSMFDSNDAANVWRIVQILLKACNHHFEAVFPEIKDLGKKDNFVLLAQQSSL